MFNSNDFLLSKILDPDSKVASSPNINMTDGNITRNYKMFRQSVSSLKFSRDESFDEFFDDLQRDNRLQSIRAILNTEMTYLKRIRELLTDILDFFDKTFNKLGKRHIMSQVYELFDRFPAINELHLKLQENMREALRTTKEIGKVLFEFLSQEALLNVYTSYVATFSNSMEFCRSIKEKGYINKNAELMNVEAIITSPIQRFPQLSMAIKDIYKYTPDSHTDKIPLFKAVAICKSITSRLDRQRREFEYSNFTEIDATLQRLKQPFTSKQLLTNNSVFDVRTDYQIPRRIVKIAYYLILCDDNVVMLPRDVPFVEMSEKTAFSFNLKDVECKQKVLSNFREQSNGYSDIEDARNMYTLVNDSFSNDATVREYELLLNDYRILMKLSEDLRFLNFRYHGIDTLKLSKSLIDLEHQLKSKEIELNLQLGSILTLTIRVASEQEFKKVFIFDSIRQSNEWRMNFNRAKLLLATDMATNWKYYSFSKKSLRIRAKEMPVLFDPFLLKNNGIIDIPPGIVKAQSVAIVVGWKIYRCMWICLTNGWVVILHFDYKQWMVLESFKMERSQRVSAICVSGTSNIDSPDHPYDSEIWMSSGEVIFIHSLHDNQRAIVKKRLELPAEVKSMCCVNNKMMVALKSKKVFIYSKTQSQFWLQESEFSFKRYPVSIIEELREIVHGHGYVYVIFKSKIIICNNTGISCSPMKLFDSPREMTTFFVSPEGVWVTTINSSQLILYDKLLDKVLQEMSIPSVLYKSYSVGNVTSIYISDRYTWLGTEKGMIICIATIDSLYCTDNKIPMYFSSVCSEGPVTQLMPFQNIHGVNVRYLPEDYASRTEIFDQRIPLLRRSMSNPPIEEGFQRLSFSCQNINKLGNNSKDELDSLSNSSLQSAIENLKNTTPTLILGFGTGTAKYKEKTEGVECEVNREAEHIDQSTLFTFLE